VVDYSVELVELSVYFDPTQLQQVVWNLCQNGLRYSADSKTNPRLELRVGITESSRRVHLDIIDRGPGINSAIAEQIFEPFFTTDKKGTGLGLYIARELCELNKATIKYIPSSKGGSCFRIEFAGKSLDTR